MSGGERRRVALARLLVPQTDLLILDEPTNHLDIEAIAWLADHLKNRTLIVVTHDRWFLDEVTDRTWEVADGQVHRYEGGYSAYVLAKAERARIAASTEEKRQNLLRKELAWLRRGPQARSTKPKFRVDAANALIADEPPARDSVELVRFATARLGKTVYDVEDATRQHQATARSSSTSPGSSVRVTASGSSASTAVARPRCSGCSKALSSPSAARSSPGRPCSSRTCRRSSTELDPTRRVLETVEEIKQRITLGKKEYSAGQMLERFGFRGDAQWTPVGDLSGGERRRLQLLRLLMAEPNVLLLDEPTNDLDIETLTELEDLLDGWPGSLVLVSHDRYFLERVSDHVVAAARRRRPEDAARRGRGVPRRGAGDTAGGTRTRRLRSRATTTRTPGRPRRTLTGSNAASSGSVTARRSCTISWPRTPPTTRSCSPSTRS